MDWNYRIVNMPSENGGDDFYALREVLYDGGAIYGHAEPGHVGTEDRAHLPTLAQRIAAAFAQPILHEDDFPPNPQE